eukprot:6197102-Pleurochrysis_carterae.AAC.2
MARIGLLRRLALWRAVVAFAVVRLIARELSRLLVRRVDVAMFRGFAFVTIIWGPRIFQVQGVARQLGLTLRDCEFSFVLGHQLLQREAQVAGRVG